VNATYTKYKTLQQGKNADYIPALAKLDPNLFGVTVMTVDGKAFSAGDVKSEVSIQSISKVFTLANVIKESGGEAVEERIGIDANGPVFKAIAAIEQYKGKELNPFITPVAIATTSMVKGASEDEKWEKLIRTYSDFAGRSLKINEEVYRSVSEANQHNQAIADLMFAQGRIEDSPQKAMDLYTRQFSIGVNTKDLATMAATLANHGRNPVTGKDLMEHQQVAAVLGVMATAGLEDESGKWLFATGLPASGGAGGGLIAVSPGKFGIAVISPPLDDAGNSVRGQKVIAEVSKMLHGNPYLPETKAKTLPQ
jgi:glutaminase